MALGKTNLAVLAKAFGTKVTAWIGQTIEVYLDESVMFAGQFTGGLRVRVPKPPLRPAPPAAAAEFDESLPGF